MEYVGVTELKKRTRETIEKTQHNMVMVMKSGKPVAVLISVTSFKAMQAMMTLAKDSEALKQFVDDHQKVREGDLSGFVDLDDVEEGRKEDE